MEPVVAKLVEYVYASGGCSVEELVDSLGVCERTIRKYAHLANRDLESCAELCRCRGMGYVVDVHDAEAFDRLRKAHFRDGREVPQTAAERMVSAFYLLLSADGWVSANVLAAQLFVSTSTLSLIIAHVREHLDDYGLTVRRRPHYGMRVEGPEFEKRLCFESAVVSSGCSEECASGILGQDLAAVRSCLVRSLACAGVSAEEVACRDATVSLAVALSRLEGGFGVTIPSEVSALLGGPRLTALADALAVGIREDLGVELPADELVFVVMHLAFWQGVDEPMEDSSTGLVGRILDSLEKTFHCRLHDDGELCDDLVHHIRLLCLRLIYRTPTHSVPVRGVQETLPFSFVLANETCRMIERRAGRTVPEGERDALVFIYARALSRRLGTQVCGTTVIVSSVDAVVRDYLRCRVQLEFGGDVVCVPGWEDVPDIMELSDVCCVLTTDVDAPQPSVPVIRVSPFFTGDDLVRVRRSHRMLPGFEALASAFRKDLFLWRRKAEGAAGAVREVASAMVRSGVAAGDDFVAQAVERSSDARCLFGNQVACVYLDEPLGGSTAMACMELERPVLWAGEPVRLVAVVNVAPDASEEEVRPLLGVVARLGGDRAAVKKVLDDGTYQGLMGGLLGFAGGEAPWHVAPGHLGGFDPWRSA